MLRMIIFNLNIIIKTIYFNLSNYKAIIKTR